jgi:chemotaxis protein methyltransferase WspC
MMSASRDDSLSEVFRLLQEYAGIEPESLGKKSIEFAIDRRMAATGEASVDELCRRLASDRAAMEELIEELLVPETWFFRDPLAYQSLSGFLVEKRWSTSDPIRVLSIACSTGEEVYSLAMLLRAGGLEPPQYGILAVDLSRAALSKAHAARYPATAFRDLGQRDAALRDRWCERIGDAWQVSSVLQEGIEYRRANVSQPDFLVDEPPFHVIFCRNVLIYLCAAARSTTMDHVRRLLHPDGLVYSAPAEAHIFAESGFRSLSGVCPFAFGRTECRGDSGREPVQKLRQFAKIMAAVNRPMPIGARHAGSSLSPGHAGLTSAATAPRKAASKTALQTAQDAADRGELQEADAICDSILADDVACADAHCLRGIIRQVQGKTNEAEQSFAKALYLDPRHRGALTHVMLLAEHRGDLLGAANYRRRLEELTAGGGE